MNNEPRHQWEECLKIFRDNLTPEQYNMSFAFAEFKAYEDGRLLIGVPSDFIKDLLESQYAALMRKTFQRVFGQRILLYYKVLEVKKPETTVTVEAPGTNGPDIKEGKGSAGNLTPDLLTAPRVDDLDSQLRKSYNFGNFIQGESNLLARTVGLSIAKNPAKTFNPFFVYGPSGCGKTHLVNAIGLRIKELHPEMRVLYLSAHLFTVQYMDAVKQNKVTDFIAFYQTIDTLIIDDIHELSGKQGTQNAFFHIFNHLHINGKQIILTCDRPPIAIDGLEDRLLTRFKWGLQAEIEKPTRQLRFNILSAKVHNEGLRIPNTVLSYISEKVNESVRDLEGIINSLMAYSVVYNCEIDMKLLQRVMPKFVEVKDHLITVDDIKKKACEYFGIKMEMIDSRSRKQPISYIRQLVIYLANEHTEASQLQIGLSVGGRNHATVIHSINTVKNLIETDQKARTDISEIEKLLTI